MISDAWSVVVVPFPFVDAPRSRTRPALVLSQRKFNEAHGHSLLAMITTAARSHWPSDHLIEDWADAGLRCPCVVRLKIFTLENRLLNRSIGVLGKVDRTAVSKQLRYMLGQVD